MSHQTFKLTRIGILPFTIPIVYSALGFSHTKFFTICFCFSNAEDFLHSSYVDKEHDTIFVSSDNGTIFRIELRTFSVFDYIIASSRYGPLVVANSTSSIPETRIFWGGRSNPTTIAVVRPAGITTHFVVTHLLSIC